MDAKLIHMAEAARRIGIPPSALSSLRYRGLLAEIELLAVGNSTLLRETDLPRLAAIARQHTRHPCSQSNKSYA